MAKLIRATINAELLSWAREQSGYELEEAAKKLGVPPDRLAGWESGVSRPTVNQLRKIAQVYRRPLAVFYLPMPPTEFQAMRDFRTLPDEASGDLSPQLRLAIREAVNRREIAIELLELIEEPPASFTASIDLVPDVESIAEHVRTLIGVSIENQRSWRDPYAALTEWRAAIERLGVLVFQSSGIEVREMRGFSIAEETLPTIVLNIKDAPYARVFTLMHEFAHLLLRSGGLCDLSVALDPRSEAERIEIFCNHLAGSILVPREQLLVDGIVTKHTSGSEWSALELDALSSEYGVSREVILRRLVTLDRASSAFYARWRREQYEALEGFRSKAPSGFLPQHRVPIVRSGRPFVRLVLDAYHQERITASDVSDYLGIRLKHLAAIEQEVVV